MGSSSASLLTFEEFRDLIAKELMIDREKVVREASFVEDLLVDSIRMVEMMLHLEELGINIPMEAAWMIRTVGDAYEQYRKHAFGHVTSSRPATAQAGGSQ